MRWKLILEVIIVIVAITVLTLIVIPIYSRVKDNAKQTEAKANIHIIQIAVEQYQTDTYEYPQWLIGGTRGPKALTALKVQDEVQYSTYPETSDILLREGYIDSYPKNPFVPLKGKERNLLLTLQESLNDPMRSGEFGDKHGYRLGKDGTIVGNVMAELRYVEWVPTVRPGSDNSGSVKPIPTGADVNFKQYDQYPEGSLAKEQIITPGQFLYKADAIITFPMIKDKRRIPVDPEEKDFIKPTSIANYFLGVIGPSGTRGEDLIGPEVLARVKSYTPARRPIEKFVRTWTAQENMPPYNGSPFGEFYFQGPTSNGRLGLYNENGVPDAIIMVVGATECF